MRVSNSNVFKDRIRRAIALYKARGLHQKDLAADLDVALQTLSAKLHEDEPTFDIHNCLIFADVTGDDPSAIFQEAGKGDIDALIKRVYRMRRRSDLTEEQLGVIAGFERASEKAKAIVLAVLQHDLELPKPGAPLAAAPHRPATTRRSRRVLKR